MNKKVGDRSRNRNISLEQHIGHRLQLIRTANELSRSDIAEVLGVSHQQLEKYEKGSNRIAASTLFQLITYFKVAPDYFFEGYKGKLPEDGPTLGTITQEGTRVMNEIGKAHNIEARQRTTAVATLIVKALNQYYHEESIQLKCKEMLERE
jgi:transcriptional regulator with XRE-family HTH domain